MPIERSGNLSRRRTSQTRAPAAPNIHASRASSKAVPGSGVMARKTCRMISIENNETHRPTQVTALIAAGLSTAGTTVASLMAIIYESRTGKVPSESHC